MAMINLNFRCSLMTLSQNDFNTLCKSLPADRQNYAVGVPGSFHNQLFPKASINFIHCWYGLQWLSSTPKEFDWPELTCLQQGEDLLQKRPKWGCRSISAESAKAIESFLQARVQELVSEGLMALILPCLPDGISLGECSVLTSANLLGDCHMDMAKMVTFDSNFVRSIKNIDTI